MTKLRKASYVSIVVVMGILFLLLTVLKQTGILSRYLEGILIMICINIILATSLNITVGCMGQINLGHAGFMSVGAYAAALFTKSALVEGIPGYLISIIIAGVVAGIIGIIVGIPALRLKGDYLAIITLAFGEIIRVLIEYFNFTGGAQGLVGIPKFSNLSLIFSITVISVAMMYSIMTSRQIGRASCRERV